MKKFQTIKITFEAYLSVRTDTNAHAVKDMLNEKLQDKLELFCTDNAFGFTEPETTLEIQE